MEITLKYGREVLTNGGLGLDMNMVNSHTQGVADFLDSSQEETSRALIVTSGATEEGRREFRDMLKGEEDPSDQLLAMMGCDLASVAIRDCLRSLGVPTATLFLTHHEIEDNKERPVLDRGLEESYRRGISLVINENDALSTKELAKLSYGGDNDGLASHLSIIRAVDYFIVFTAMGGFLDEDNHEVRTLEDFQFARALALAIERDAARRSDGKKSTGAGGMTSKLEATKEAADKGVATWIAKAGSHIEDVIDGKTGTRIMGKAA